MRFGWKALTQEEYEAKWQSAQQQQQLTNIDTGRRRKALCRCDIEGVEYDVGDRMPMSHWRIMKRLHDVYGVAGPDPD